MLQADRFGYRDMTAMKIVIETAVIKRAAKHLWCDGARWAFCSVIFSAYAVSLIIAGFVLPHFDSVRYDPFGFNQLSSIGARYVVIILCVIILSFLLFRKFDHQVGVLVGRVQKAFFSKTIYIIVFGLLCVTVFLLLRNNFINYDGLAFTEKFHRDVAVNGAHVTHDEMWELYVHSRFWYYTKRHIFLPGVVIDSGRGIYLLSSSILPETPAVESAGAVPHNRERRVYADLFR